MTVQVATCSAAQLFSGCLIADHASPTKGVVSSGGQLVRGELTIPEYQRPYCWQDKKRYRITSKNSVEHVHPQNEEFKNHMPKESLDAFGNLVLLSPGENSSYSNQAVLKKKANFESKPRYDSLKLKAIFDLHSEVGGHWREEEIAKHQRGMLDVLRKHYSQ